MNTFSEGFERAAIRELRAYEQQQAYLRGVREETPQWVYGSATRAELGAWGVGELHPVALESRVEGFRWLSFGESRRRVHPGLPIVRLHDGASRAAISEIAQGKRMGRLEHRAVRELLLVALDLTNCTGIVGIGEGPNGGSVSEGEVPFAHRWYLVGKTAHHCELSNTIGRFHEVLDGVFELRRRPAGWLEAVREYLGSHGFSEHRQDRRRWAFEHLEHGSIRLTLYDNGMMEKLAHRAAPTIPDGPVH